MIVNKRRAALIAPTALLGGALMLPATASAAPAPNASTRTVAATAQRVDQNYRQGYRDGNTDGFNDARTYCQSVGKTRQLLRRPTPNPKKAEREYRRGYDDGWKAGYARGERQYCKK